jgi:hypothetical protein
MAWPELSWGDDPKGFRAVADQIAYRTYSYRDMAKKLGHGCLTKDHEVLTPSGWVSITEKPDVILEWDENGSRFTQVSNWVDKTYNGDLHSFEGTSISALMTADHRVPYKADQRSQGIKTRPASAGPQAFMPLGGRWEGGNTVVPAKLIAAFMADGYQETNHMTFHFHKQRKKDRLISLCEEYGYEYKIHGDKIRVKGRLPKYPGAFQLNWTAACLKDFVMELRYWDGHIGETSISIYSTRLQDLEWFQLFGRICGVGGNIQKPQISGFGSTVYSLQQNNRQYANGGSVKHTIYPNTTTRVYCPTVPSSWFYARRNGKIFVTGNSNYMGQPKTMAGHTKVPTEQIAEFQRKYFSGFPCVKKWQEETVRLLQTTGSLTHLFGRRRYFFGRLTDQPVINAAIAYCPQGMTGDAINEGILRLWHDPRFELLVQVHDSILFQIDQNQVNELVPLALELLKAKLTLAGDREFYIPVEAKTGWNWGDKDAANPLGLAKWRGAESRTPPARVIPQRRVSIRSYL